MYDLTPRRRISLILVKLGPAHSQVARETEEGARAVHSRSAPDGARLREAPRGGHGDGEEVYIYIYIYI